MSQGALLKNVILIRGGQKVNLVTVVLLRPFDAYKSANYVVKPGEALLNADTTIQKINQSTRADLAFINRFEPGA